MNSYWQFHVRKPKKNRCCKKVFLFKVLERKFGKINDTTGKLFLAYHLTKDLAERMKILYEERRHTQKLIESIRKHVEAAKKSS